MAAAPNRCATELVELSQLRAGDLDTLLAEEQLAWRSRLSWDFTASADLVRRFIAIRALNGFALMAGSHPAGYAYFVSEERKGLIGDLYVVSDWATPENEYRLLSAILQVLVGTPGVERIEAQLMMLHGPFARALPMARFGQIYPRIFMLADLQETSRLPILPDSGSISFETWDQSFEDDAARVISAAYREHIDSNINDQYRSYPGARRFLHNVVQYPGCGSFFSAGSYAAIEGNKLIGLVLASLVASDTGHITQVCVAPEKKRAGVGYELVRRSLLAMRKRGCERTSLTVTADNRTALSLYQRMGFRAVRRFAAYVWEGF
ncbi:MAG: GNAT family N-acetyltransferase [Bryobacteraceae bacterium]|nr:GNAT family N-acetyltransferase [Bryobacteraceae bacterium]